NGQIYFAPRWKQMLGYLEHELPNATSTWTNLLHPDDRDQTERHVQAFLSRELDAYEVEFRMRHKEGHYVPILSRAFGSFDATGKALRLVGTHIDLTYRKKVERERQIGAMQLQQAHRLEAIGQLAAGIAHEINTPTQYIGDNTRFLQDSFADLKKVLDAYGELVQAASSHPEWLQPLQKIEEAARSADLDYLAVEIPKAIQQSLDGVERVSHIVRAMKDFSHPGSSEKTLVDLHKAIESTITVCRNEWKYVAEIATTFYLGLPPVPALPGALNQVILNLVVNAAHAIADVVGNGGTDRGMIHISTKQDGNWVEIRISDTGTGIPEPARGRIFDPFFTTKPVGKGTGQGLAISHNVVTEKHGGTLSFETELGKGTTFIIRLPLDTPALKAA
ncbi:MAG: domain S-box protein, partial [Verrucomicrobiales bacterium]|nr:domain S-box protein [Verrucomicrobiales bacterium]